MLVYIDESGYPIPTDASTKSVLLAVCIREADIRGITSQFYSLKNRIYGKQTEIKSTNLLNPKTISKNRTNNKEYAESVISILESYQIGVFAVVMDRPDFTPYTAEGMLPVQYHRLLQRIQWYCENHQTTMAMCVFDQTDDGRDARYAQGFNNFLFRSAEGMGFDKILVSPFFVSSTVTSTIELPDICAGVVRNFFQLGLNQHPATDPYEEWIAELYHRIEKKSENFRRNCRTYYGIYQLPVSCFNKKEE